MFVFLCLYFEPGLVQAGNERRALVTGEEMPPALQQASSDADSLHCMPEYARPQGWGKFVHEAFRAT